MQDLSKDPEIRNLIEEGKYIALLQHPKVRQATRDSSLADQLKSIDIDGKLEKALFSSGSGEQPDGPARESPADSGAREKNRSHSPDSPETGRRPRTQFRQMKYLVTIGLEVHCQVKTNSKMFCACPADFGDDPNTHTCPVCLGLPGALPVLNSGAIEKTILAGLMLGCSTPPVSKWDRKNYFYPDMPKNYQISQFDLPLCLGGGVPLYDHCYPKDAQKEHRRPRQDRRAHPHPPRGGRRQIHPPRATTLDDRLQPRRHAPDGDRLRARHRDRRGGLRLPQLPPDRSSSTAALAMPTWKRARCAATSTSPSARKGRDELGAKIELKNLNSISAVRRSLHYEIERQTEAWRTARRSDPVDPPLGRRARRDQQMRTKEDAHDYRYFPDPDLLPVQHRQHRRKDAPASARTPPPEGRSLRSRLRRHRLRRHRPRQRPAPRRLLRSRRQDSPRRRRKSPTGSSTTCSARSTSAAWPSPTARSPPKNSPRLVDLVEAGDHLQQPGQGGVRRALREPRAGPRRDRQSQGLRARRQPARSKASSTRPSPPTPTRSPKSRPATTSSSTCSPARS